MTLVNYKYQIEITSVISFLTVFILCRKEKKKNEEEEEKVQNTFTIRLRVTLFCMWWWPFSPIHDV